MPPTKLTCGLAKSSTTPLGITYSKLKRDNTMFQSPQETFMLDLDVGELHSLFNNCNLSKKKKKVPKKLGNGGEGDQ